MLLNDSFHLCPVSRDNSVGIHFFKMQQNVLIMFFCVLKRENLLWIRKQYQSIM